jgi:hypothetical protein
MSSIAKKIMKSLKKFTKVLESGEPLENHFKITKIERVNKFENVVTVKGPKKKRK